MIETALIAAVAAAAAYGVARWRSTSDADGCNGHHWNDTEPVTEVSLSARKSAGYGDKIVRGSNEGYSTRLFCGEVSLKQKAVKRCDDCGTYTKDTIYVGSIPKHRFEESKDGR